VPLNALGQDVGEEIPGWVKRPRPPRTAMAGRTCRVEPLDLSRHGADLEAAFALPGAERNWTYLHYGPFADRIAYRQWLATVAPGDDPLFHAVIDGKSGAAVGLASYLRIDVAHGAIEVGHLNFSPRLQRTVVATEAMALMMARAFDELGYRRYEWKCDSRNAPSRAAALRLGFRFEGIFRRHMVVKGRNRDTAWFAITAEEWPALRQAFARWLDPANFDAGGQQRRSLAALREGV
jgi:RimJ/RimL family protein N-acetyltransferase